MQTTVKNWFAQKGYGFLYNGSENAPDIIVYATELRNCQYLKRGRIVEFECHINDNRLIAKNVKLIHENTNVPKPYQNHHSIEQHQYASRRY